MPDPEPEAPSAASPDASTPSSPSSTSSPVRSTDQSSSTGLEPGSDLTSDRVVLDAEDISRALTRMAHQILETNRGPEGLVLAGIPSRGVPLAERLARAIAASEGIEIPTGALDITMYRDDLRQHPTRMVGHTHLPAGIDGAVVVLVDDVLFSGRTVRAALDALGDLGRPRAVRLAVLVDRGHRQLPIRADHVGKNLLTADEERVLVRLEETDGVNEVRILRPPPEAPAPTATGSSNRGGL